MLSCKWLSCQLSGIAIWILEFKMLRGCLNVISITYRVRVNVDLCPGIKGVHMVAKNVYFIEATCEHFNKTKGDSIKLVFSER